MQKKSSFTRKHTFSQLPVIHLPGPAAKIADILNEQGLRLHERTEFGLVIALQSDSFTISDRSID